MPAKNRHATTKRQIGRLRKGGWTMEGIARSLGVSLRTVQHWNAGTREIEPETLPGLENLPTKFTAPAKVSA